jgi:long-subunit acyl-CoA synthetase (AMP-forming)
MAAPTLQTAIHGEAKSVAVIIPSKPNALTIAYEDLIREVFSFQRKLAAIGITKGSPVSISILNSYEFIVSFLAASWQRGIAAPLNPAYKQGEFEFYIEDVKSAIVLVPKGACQSRSPAVRAAKKFSAAVAECYWDAERKEVVLDVKDLGQLKSKGRQPILKAQPDDVALVLHTRYARLAETRGHSCSDDGEVELLQDPKSCVSKYLPPAISGPVPDFKPRYPSRIAT